MRSKRRQPEAVWQKANQSERWDLENRGIADIEGPVFSSTAVTFRQFRIRQPPASAAVMA